MNPRFASGCLMSVLEIELTSHACIAISVMIVLAPQSVSSTDVLQPQIIGHSRP